MEKGTCCKDVLVNVSATKITEIYKYGGLYHASKIPDNHGWLLHILQNAYTEIFPSSGSYPVYIHSLNSSIYAAHGHGVYSE